MSDHKCGQSLFEAADHNILTLKAVQFRYEGLGPGREPIDRPTALARVEELGRHVRARLAGVE